MTLSGSQQINNSWEQIYAHLLHHISEEVSLSINSAALVFPGEVITSIHLQIVEYTIHLFRVSAPLDSPVLHDGKRNRVILGSTGVWYSCCCEFIDSRSF